MDDHSFRPTWWLPGGHGHTLWAAFARSIALPLRSRMLELPDGDCVQVDAVGEAGPIVVLLPGLAGDAASPYVRMTLRACLANGWRGLLLNHRGRPKPNRLPQSYHSGLTRDVDYFVRLLHAREPTTPIAVVSFSLGANICLKWLGDAGQRGDALPVAAAVAVSPPFQPGAAARHIERGFARIYQRHLLRHLHRDVMAKMKVIDCGLNLTPAELRTLTTFHRFDDRITAPLHGFNGADDYYDKVRTDRLLRHIATPTLIVSARDDPFVPPHTLPRVEDVSPHVTLDITRTGGHLGFITGTLPWRTRSWLASRVPAFVAQHVNAPAGAGAQRLT